MKCAHCNKELDFPAAVLEQLTDCPFCQQPLEKGSSSDSFSSLRSFFTMVVSKYGEEVFSDDSDKNIYEILNTYSDKYAREVNILRLLCDFSIPKTLYEALDDVDDEKPAVVKSVKRLSQFLVIPSDTAFVIVKALAEAMGFNTIDKIKEVKLEANDEKKLFDALGIPENATLDQVKSAYRKIVMVNHPDKNPDDPRAVEIFRAAQEAYEILSNPQKRKNLSESEKNSDFMNRMMKLDEDFPAYSDKLYLVFILHYARKIYDSTSLSSEKKAALLRDYVDELHNLLGVSTFALWEVFSLISDAFNLKGCLSENAEDLVTPDGNRYKTIKVGDDIWMAENYRGQSRGSCAYGRDEKNVATYGRLYDWKDAVNFAPEGWHLPSEKEFETLLSYFKTQDAYALRSKDWLGASNLTGFCDLPAGALDDYTNGGFHSMGICSFYWTSSSEAHSTKCLKIDEEKASWVMYDCKTNKFSVRYVKNQSGYVDSQTGKKNAAEKTPALNTTQNCEKDGSDGNIFTDSRDGNRYRTRVIGNKVWMLDNFRFKCDGSHSYMDQNENVERVGLLYSLETARAACPAGWHLPSRKDFKNLVSIFKSSGCTLGEMGFGDIPSGYRDSSGTFAGLDNDGFEVSCFWGLDLDEAEQKSCCLFVGCGTGVGNVTKFSLETCCSVRYVRNLKPGEVPNQPKLDAVKPTVNTKSVTQVARTQSAPQSSNVYDGYDGKYFTDSRDQTVYRTVTIGNKVWLAENFKFACPGSYLFENKEKYLGKYGRLYPWDVAKSVCPPGWHLPTGEEYKEIVMAVAKKHGGDNIAKKLKAADEWFGGKGTIFGGSDVAGFTIRPAGSRGSSGEFVGGPDDSINFTCLWCAEHAEKSNHAHMLVLYSDSDDVDIKGGYVGSCCSVRYVRDKAASIAPQKPASSTASSATSADHRQDDKASANASRDGNTPAKRKSVAESVGELIGGCLVWIVIIYFVLKACSN